MTDDCTRPRYFEDIALDVPAVHGDYEVTKEEIVSFARKWDPQPFHLDEGAAEASVFGGLSTCAAHNFSMLSKLIYDHGKDLRVLAGLGIDEMRFRAPARPGDRLRVRKVFIEKRESKSRPDAGIARSHVQLLNQRDEVILDAKTTALIAKRPASG